MNSEEIENFLKDVRSDLGNLDELINEFPLQRIRFSKYCNGINR